MKSRRINSISRFFFQILETEISAHFLEIHILTSPSATAAISSLTTSNSPRKRVSLLGSTSYLSMRKSSRFTPGTVSMRPS